LIDLSEIGINLTEEGKFLSVRRWQAGPEWWYSAHAHPYCEIIVVVSGSERAVLGEKTLVCEPGHVLFYPPACVHEEWQVGEVLLEFICLKFEWSTLPCGVPHLCHDRQGRLQEIIRWMLAEEKTGYARKRRYQDMSVQMLTTELLRLVESHPADIVVATHEYIQEHLDRPITLDDLAEHAQLNKFHFIRVFRARSGMTPMQYVRQIRLDAAHRLVLETMLPLREIAPRVGFADEYHLSRLIKVRYGRGARELRRSNKISMENIRCPDDPHP
jgi:AraC-like DNA-binding protein